MSNAIDGHSAWRYALTVYLRGPTEPSLLQQHVEELTCYLRSGDVEIQMDGTGR